MAVIVIMGIIFTIGFYSYSSYVNKNKNKMYKIEVEQIKVAASAYLREIETDPNYKFYSKKIQQLV